MGLIFKKSTAQPAFTVAAAITGTTEATQTLTCAYTVVRARTANVTCRWYRHTADDGTDPTGVLLGTGNTYTLTGTDVGNYIRAIVTAINPAGEVESTTPYTSAITPGDPPEPPALVTPAAITGTADVGETLTVTYSFTGQDSVAIQWYSYSTQPTGNPLAGDDQVLLGTASTQALTESESGRWIVAVVTATNAVDSTVTSASVAMAGVDPWTPLAPTEYAIPAYSTEGMRFVYANSGDDLQAKINSLIPGDCLVVEAGATWVGNFYFPNTNANGTDWIYVISSAMADLPPEGTRVTAADAANMPAIKAGSASQTAMNVHRGVKKVRFVGLELSTTYDVRTGVQYSIIPVGSSDYGTGDVDEVIFDRCYVHGTPTGNNRDGINTYYRVKRFAIVDCEVSDFHGVGYESHAIHIQDGQGPMLIRNNKLEAASICAFIGDSSVPFGLPKDITFIGNYCTKKAEWDQSDPSYAGIQWQIKNTFEVKYGERIHIEANIFERSWYQVGPPGGIILTPIGEKIADVVIRNNIVRDIRQPSVSILLAASGAFATAAARLDRCLCENNLIYNCYDTGIGITGGTNKYAQYITIAHNSCGHSSVTRSGAEWMGFNQTSSTAPSAINIDVRDNCYTAGQYHVGTNGIAGDTAGLGVRCSGEWYYRHNMAVEAAFPYSTWFDDNNANVYGHINRSSRTSAKFASTALAAPADFVLAADSAGHNAATDGTDIGCDISALLAAIAAHNDTTP